MDMEDPICPSIESYQVGWICAIDIEHRVAMALLRPRVGSPVTPKEDTNNYTCGKIAGHNVVIACIAKGRYGIANAASTAQNMQRSFPSLRFRLMVGIGGGAPTPTQDIRLGDVVVSSPAGRRPAVIHYEFGKTIQNEEFQPLGILASPPVMLLNVLNTVDNLHKLKGSRLRRTIKTMIDSYPRIEQDIARPDPTSDILFASGSVHKDASSSCGKLGCASHHPAVARPRRTLDETEPYIHYGLIASADRLMKNAVQRDRLAERHGALCFEMEAAGLMDNFPCLVVRGISDYSDTHKNDEWQGYAAAVAAAYAKEILKTIPSAHHLSYLGGSKV
ncbi:nucleoside phosphorylase domain-containing protein [Elsinoe ampelina]|uniref:Nucleoside phosphorylase domain-containing protein n=1 Tax=Elsinoe ampelina TaxID=302913 RepID=A0A6A6GQQ9_9PEZI|nr:nucleoside phosphorylase domain-containing protein [Elsinoe ampelina]